MNPPGLFSLDFLRKSRLKFHESAGASYQDLGFWFITIISASRIYFHKEAYYYYRQDNMSSSCNSKEKVYCLCDEYAFMEEFLRSRNLMEFKEILLYKKFRSYCWNLNRIDEKFKKEFLERFAKEFKDENLKLEIFKHRELKKLKKIISNPNKYAKNLFYRFVLKNFLTKLKKAFDRLKF